MVSRKIEPYQKETSPTLVVAYLISQITNSQPGITYMYSQPHDHQEWKKSDVVKLDW